MASRARNILRPYCQKKVKSEKGLLQHQTQSPTCLHQAQAARRQGTRSRPALVNEAIRQPLQGTINRPANGGPVEREPEVAGIRADQGQIPPVVNGNENRDHSQLPVMMMQDDEAMASSSSDSSSAASSSTSGSDYS